MLTNILMALALLQVTDTVVRDIPSPPPTLLGAGKSFKDPSFGTTILQLTDASDGPGCVHAYSALWSAANSDSTKIAYMCDNDSRVATIDPVNMKLVSKKVIPAKGGSFQWMLWSHSKPNIFYAIAFGTQLISYDVDLDKITLIHDFAGDFQLKLGQLPLLSSNIPAGMVAGQPVSLFLSRISGSDDDNLISATLADTGTWQQFGYLVYNISTGKIIARESKPDYYKVQLDKTGRYLYSVYQAATQTDRGGSVLDLTTGIQVDQRINQNGGQHGDVTRGGMISVDQYQPRIIKYSLATPLTQDTFFKWDNPAQWGGIHISTRDNADDALISFETTNPLIGQGLYRDELVVARGVDKPAIRMVHHQSDWGTPVDYWALPRASYSIDGRVIVWTSNWMRSGTAKRNDVFVARVATDAPIVTPTISDVWNLLQKVAGKLGVGVQ